MLARMGDDCSCIRRMTRSRNHDRCHLLDLAASYDDAPALDDILNSVDNEQIALLVDKTDVARMKPTAGKGFNRFLRLVPIERQKLRGAVHDLAMHPGRHVSHLGIDDTCLDVENRTARRRWTRIMLFRPQHRRERTDFALSVAIERTDAREPTAQLFEYGDRHDRGAVVDVAQ